MLMDCWFVWCTCFQAFHISIAVLLSATCGHCDSSLELYINPWAASSLDSHLSMRVWICARSSVLGVSVSSGVVGQTSFPFTTDHRYLDCSVERMCTAQLA